MPKCILIVDDHAVVRQQVRAFLEGLNGFVCVEAVDGLDGVQKTPSRNPDLIVLDYQMPRRNGLEAARILRQKLPTVPIFFFTMHKDVFTDTDVKALGINAVVSKTEDLAVLAECVQSLR